MEDILFIPMEMRGLAEKVLLFYLNKAILYIEKKNELIAEIKQGTLPYLC